MKTKNLIERFSLFLLALVLTMPTWAQGGSGNESETITIASKADWGKFCDRVDGGQTKLNAKMTADVDLGEDTWQVGAGRNYSGTFDGQGHTLTVNWNSALPFSLAPFADVENATIKNLHVKGQITNRGDLSGLMISASGTTTVSGCVIEVNLKSSNDVAGMIKWTQPNSQVTITDCVVKGALNSDATNDIAGFVYLQTGYCTLNNCLYAGTNNATAGSYTFANGATLTNCYYLNACGKAQGTPTTKEQLRSGEVAHLLQNGRSKTVWGQLLGTDTIPQLTAEAAKHVYEVKFTLNNEVKAMRYANSGQSIHGGLPTAQDLLGTGYNPHHYYAIAFEGGFNASTTVTADRQVTVSITEKDCYEIASKEDWKAFCDRVNSGQTTLNAKLTQDVDLGGEIKMAGTEDLNSPSYNAFFYYTGTFDGQGHTLKFNWNAGEKNYIAPFAFVKDATIKNLRTQGKITTKGYNLSGMVYGAFGTTTLTGCISDVDITGGNSGLASSNAAGMVQAVAYGASVQITDCLVKGRITDNADESDRAMAGFVFYNGGTYTLTRCLYVGKNNAANNGYSKTFGRDSYGISATFTDCYYLNPCGKAQGTQITEAQLKNGYVAYKLQKGIESQVWGQTLGTDNEPQLTTDATKRVYEVKFVYNGEVKATRYANSGQTVALPTAEELLGAGYNPKMTYMLNFGDFTANTPVTEDKSVDVTVTGTFNIASKEDWKAFCDLVGSGQTKLNAKMINDVDLGGDIAMVGNNYSGTFDGQHHTLKINWNSGSQTWIAPFYSVDGATIKNLRVEGEIKSSTHFLSGLAGDVYGTTTISGCVSAVNITSSYNEGGCDAAGMIECVRDNAKVTITDCVVKGKFNATTEKGKRYMAGFVCNQNGTCTLTNCLYVGENNGTGVNTHTFGYKTTLTNCYYLNACGEAQGERIVEKQLKSGEVTKKLQGDRTDSCHWAQVLGEWPGLYRETDKAKPNYVYYNKENNGWTCDDFRLTDGESLPIGLDFTATKATYDRTLAAGKATLCLPYELPVQGFRAYTLADRQESRTAVHFKEVNGTLEAYRPYLLVADAPARLDGENLQVKADCSSIVLSAGNYYFKGAVHDVVNWWLTSDHAYILQADGLFHKVTSDNPSVTVPAYRAYISYNSHEGAKPLSIVFDGETTGIGGTTDDTTDGAADGAADGAVYNLQGQRVADRLDDSVRRQIPAGVYIVNGRKVVVK